MACGAYHSMVVLGDPSKNFKKVHKNTFPKEILNLYIGVFSGKIREEAGCKMVIGVF